jgi:molybdopterin synthase sulfur carrier subunit
MLAGVPQGYGDEHLRRFPSRFSGVNEGFHDMSSARGTVRYWAAAREAAGVAEEPYAADTLAAALDAAVAAHGGPRGPLAHVLARCSFLVDGAPASRPDPSTVVLTDAGTIDVLPPFAGGSGEGSPTVTEMDPVDSTPVAASAAGRVWDHFAVPSLLTALAAGVLVAASADSRVGLLAVVAVIQAGLVAGWFVAAGLRVPRLLAAACVTVALGAAVAADVVIGRTPTAPDYAQVRGIAGVLAALVGVAFVVQLVRPAPRVHVTGWLVATVASGTAAVGAALFVAVRDGRGGVDALAVGLVAAGVAVLPVQRFVPSVLAFPLGLGVAVAAGEAVHRGVVGPGAAAALAATAATVVLCARLAMPAGRRTAALSGLLGVALVATPVLVVARIMLG